jgi:transposase
LAGQWLIFDRTDQSCLPFHVRWHCKFEAFVTDRPAIVGAARDVIEAPKLEPWFVRYELSDFEWAAIKPFLPNKSRGVRRVNDRRVLNGIFWVLRSGAHPGAICRFAMAHAPPATTASSGGERPEWDRIMNSLAAAHDAAVQMIDTSIVRVRRHAACIARNRSQSMGRSRGGLTSKIHAVVDTNGLPVRLRHFVPPRRVLSRDEVTGFGIDVLLLQTIAGFPIDPVETYLFR